MIPRIAFVNTAHYSFDDRVFYHQALSLQKNGYEVFIISSKHEVDKIVEGVVIKSFNDSKLSQKNKITKITTLLKQINPTIVFCDSPLSVFATRNYKSQTKQLKIIYDVTEWYPSKKNLNGLTTIRRIIKSLMLFSTYLLAGFITDNFIFGEYHKSLIYKTLFFWKKCIFLPYYPSLAYIENQPQNKIQNEVNLLYSGIINKDKGIDSIFSTLNEVIILCPSVIFNLNIIGNFPTNEDKIHFEQLKLNTPKNIIIKQINHLDFNEFCQTITEADLFFDLRRKDFENNYCLPIKLFYYIACGRPVIYSNLSAITRFIHNFNFGILIEPNDSKSIARYIYKCINNQDFYKEQCENALKASHNKYNWDLIEKRLLDFIQN